MYGILSKHELSDSDANLVGVFITPLELSSDEPLQRADTLNYKRVLTMQRAHRWRLVAEIAPSLTGRLFGVLLKSLQDRSLYVRTPQPVNSKAFNSYVIGGWLGNFEPWNCHTGGLYLTAPTLKPGDFFTFYDTPGAKVYTVISNSGGVVHFWPPMMEQVADAGSAPTNIYSGNHCIMRVSLSQGTLPALILSDGILSTYPSLELTEVVA
jgi:hypothetical protein